MRYSFEAASSQLSRSEKEYAKPQQPPRFIVDAQLPKRLSDFLKEKGFDSIHTLDLPAKNATTDRQIIDLSVAENRILITKDGLFAIFFNIRGACKTYMIKTGNIGNKELMSLFEMGITVILSLIDRHPMIEISQTEIIVHN